jgi:hypothetical protein
MTPGRIDTTKPHPARMYDYYLGGKDHYEVDADAAQQVLNVNPYAAHGARSLRLFMQRSAAPDTWPPRPVAGSSSTSAPASPELVEPGVAPVHRWRPEPGDPSSGYTNAQAASWAGVARKR